MLRKELKRDFMCVLLQFLKDEKLIESQHKLEQESGCYFNLAYFEEKVMLGEWVEAETYISGFTKMDDNDGSKEIFLHIRRQKYLEESHSTSSSRAPIREYNFSSARGKVVETLRKLIGENPSFVDKMDFPNIEVEKLFELINKSSSWKVQSGENLTIEPLGEYELPLKVASTCNPSDDVTHMDFHPSQPAILLAGCLTGKIYIWDIASDDRWFYPLEIWTPSPMYSDLKDEAISVTQVAWSPDGKFFGVSFSKKLIHIYLYDLSEDLAIRYVEFEGHPGRVCDLAFCHRNERVRIVTCGDDRVVKVWQLKRKHEAPEELCKFKEHISPVTSLCIHKWNDSQVVLSTDSKGNFKVWPVWGFDCANSIATVDTGFMNITFCSTTDARRIFSFGLLDGDPFLVEWNIGNQSHHIKRIYADLEVQGVGNLAVGYFQFDISRNRFLAAGLKKVIKFWNMDHINSVTTLEGDGQFLELPCLRFSKDGNFLASTIKDRRLRIFANEEGLEYLEQFKANRSPSKQGKDRIRIEVR